MSKERPEWVRCIRSLHENPAHPLHGKTWCGRLPLIAEWCFEGVSHAAFNGMNEGRLVACPDCVGVVSKHLRHAHDEEPLHAPLFCPQCKARHLDVGEWATRPHHKHLCGSCGFLWRVEPYTFGVADDALWCAYCSTVATTKCRACGEIEMCDEHVGVNGRCRVCE